MPPRAKRRKSQDSQKSFLFVEEDANTIIQGRNQLDPLVIHQKQSHAQRRAFEHKRRLEEQEEQRVELAAALKTSDNPAAVEAEGSHVTDGFDELDPEAYFSFSQGLYRSELLLEHDQTLSDGQIWLHPSQPATPQAYLHSDSVILQSSSRHPLTYRPGYFLEDNAQTSKLKFLRSSGGLSLHSPLRGRTVHPMFSGQHNILGLWAPPLIRHFNTILIPEKFWADTRKVPLAQIRHASAIHADMQDVMSEPAHLYSFLASASAQMLSREGKLLLPELNVSDHRVTVYFKMKAIQAIRLSLMKGILDHRLVSDISCLIANEYFSNSYDAANPHIDAMLSMIQRLGGISTFDEYFIESNILLDWSAGVKRLTPPRFHENFDPGRGSAQIASTLAHMKFLDDDVGDRVHHLPTEWQPLAEAVLQHREALRLHSWCRSNTVYDPQYYRWLSLRQLAIGYRLLSMPPFRDIAAECFRTALIFWTALIRSPSGGQRCASVQAPTLLTRMQFSDLETLWRDKSDLLFWIAIVGGLASCCQLDITWFVTIATRAAEKERIDITNIADVEVALKRILYDPVVLHGSLLKLIKTMGQDDRIREDL